jgi:hypothetical protein
MPQTKQTVTNEMIWNLLLQIQDEMNRRLIALEEANDIEKDVRTRRLTPLKTLEQSKAEAHRKTLERMADPEHCLFAQTIGSCWDGKRTHEQVIADAVAEQRRMRDEEWPD